jgi:AcrR family transcriptional regulator
MVQVKKEAVRQAILAVAWRLFSQQTYQRTTLGEIARQAGISSANLYVYFDSKLDILYAVYEPWMRERVKRLEAQVAKVDRPLERIRLILRALWKDIPAEENGFVNNIVQAISTVAEGEQYRSELLDWVERKIGRMIRDALPPSRRRIVDRVRIAHVLMMALDGYSIHYHINPRGAADEDMIKHMAKLLIGRSAQVRPLRKRAGLPLAPRRGDYGSRFDLSATNAKGPETSAGIFAASQLPIGRAPRGPSRK